MNSLTVRGFSNSALKEDIRSSLESLIVANTILPIVSILIVLYPETSAGLSLTDLDRRCRDFKDGPTVASHFPSSVSAFRPINKLQECDSVDFLTRAVYEVS